MAFRGEEDKQQQQNATNGKGDSRESVTLRAARELKREALERLCLGE